MAAAWIEEIQEAIDSEGLVNIGGYWGIDFTDTPYECFLSGFTIDGEAGDCTFTLRIPNAAQFESEEFKAVNFRNNSGNYVGEALEVVSVESNNADLLITIALILEQAEAALANDNALLLACSDELEVSAFDVVSITPAAMEISFDYPTPTPAAQPLSTPTGLNAVILEDNAYLSWDGTPGATGYLIQYTDTTTDESLSSTSTIPAVHIPSMTPNHTYNWSVRAVGDEISNGNSAWSASGSFEIGPTLITKPQALRDSKVNKVTTVNVREYNSGMFSYAKIRLSTSGIWLTAGCTINVASFTFPANQLSKGDYIVYGCLYDKAQYYVPEIGLIGSFSKSAASAPIS